MGKMLSTSRSLGLTRIGLAGLAGFVLLLVSSSASAMGMGGMMGYGMGNGMGGYGIAPMMPGQYSGEYPVNLGYGNYLHGDYPAPSQGYYPQSPQDPMNQINQMNQMNGNQMNGFDVMERMLAFMQSMVNQMAHFMGMMG